MNGISFHTARGQRITNVEFSRAQTQEEIDKSNEANKQAQDAAAQDDAKRNKPDEYRDVAAKASNDKWPANASAPVTDEHPSTATDPSLKSAQLRFTLFGGEVVTVGADALRFMGGAKGRPVDKDTGLPTIQIGNDGTLNNPSSHRIDQAASMSDWLVQYFDWAEDRAKFAIFDSATLHAITRRGLN